jgi:hypothetical protein
MTHVFCVVSICDLVLHLRISLVLLLTLDTISFELLHK